MLIPINKIKQKTGIKITGIIHVGGHYGQEAEEYYNNDIKNVHFFEPQEIPFKNLKNKCDALNYKCYNVALGSAEQILDMYIEEANEGQSSSLLEPVSHLQEYPNIVFNKKMQVPVKTLDSYELSDCNFLNVDVQGYELEVLKGATNTLTYTDFVYIEVNRNEMYKGCPLIGDITNFLNTHNFILQQIVWYGTYSWGEALFIKYK